MNHRLKILVEKYMSNTCSKEELETLFSLVRETADDQPLEEALKDYWEKTKELTPGEDIDWDGNMFSLMEGLKRETYLMHEKERVNRIRWKRIAIAASLILLSGIGYWFVNRENRAPEIAQDVKAPEKNRAMIIMANGEKIYVDNAGNGTLATQGNAKVIKTQQGAIVYETNRGAKTEILYNTLTNPRGSRVVDITLSDGSKIWLNAGSTLTFPVTFIGQERKVTMTGEGYFEVVHNAAAPFKVSKGDLEVTVLGTHFNVNAYEDEPDIKVTLLEGAVKTAKRNGSAIVLKPGEQAQIGQNTEVKKEVDIAKIMAWKEGVFRFKNTNIKELMRQVARWYDVEIEYQGNTADLNFSGSVSRQDNVSELLKRLEATEMVRFRITGKKILVIPNT